MRLTIENCAERPDYSLQREHPVPGDDSGQFIKLGRTYYRAKSKSKESSCHQSISRSKNREVINLTGKVLITETNNVNSN